MKVLQKMTLGALALALVSCEGTTTREWIVSNGSSQQINVEADIPLSYLSNDPVDIAPGSSATIAETDMRGGVQYPGSATDFISSMTITLTNGDTIALNPLDEDRWLSESDRRRRVPSHWHHEYRLFIVDDDL